MKGVTHRIFGTALAIGAGKILEWNLLSTEGAIYVGSALISSTVPDLDFKLGLKHRGISHYFITSTILTGVTYFLTKSVPISAGVGVGLTSHLLGDMNTVYGVPLLAPFTHKRFRFPWAYRMPKDRSMHPLEVLIFTLCLGFIFMYQWWRI